MRYKSGFSLLLLLFQFTSPATAAPFCIDIQGITPQCDYYDAQECRLRALQLSAECIANPLQLFIFNGNERYCIVDSSLYASCLYPNKESCDNDAEKNGVCIDHAQGKGIADPFQNDPKRN